jgi:hypothetical protein
LTRFGPLPLWLGKHIGDRAAAVKNCVSVAGA